MWQRSADVVDGLLLPAIATLCTCSHERARQIPARVSVDYLACGLASQPVHRALHGADDVARCLLTGIPGLRCNAWIAGVVRHADGVQLHLADGSREPFDPLMLASQANQAQAWLRDASPAEASMLAGFAYTRVPVVRHTAMRARCRPGGATGHRSTCGWTLRRTGRRRQAG